MSGIDQIFTDACSSYFSPKDEIPPRELSDADLLIARLYRCALKDTVGDKVVDSLDKLNDPTIFENRFKEFRTNLKAYGSIQEVSVIAREKLIQYLSPFHLADVRIQRDLGLLYMEKLNCAIDEGAFSTAEKKNETILFLQWALCYLNFAHAKGDLESTFSLGELYLMSTKMTNLDSDQTILIAPKEKAYELFLIAVNAGHEKAQEKLVEMDSDDSTQITFVYKTLDKE